MADWQHRYARINGLDVHYIEQGKGPLVVLAHGFPQTWFTWARQLPAIAAAGFRAVALDMRGMGQTSAPADHRLYDMHHTAGDLVGILDHLGEEQAVFIGLDFGILAIYDMAYLHPKRMRAIVGLENPAWPHNPKKSPLTEAAEYGAKHFYHIHYFAKPGEADAALAARPREFLTRVYYALSGDFHYIDVWKHPAGTGYVDALPVAPPFPWKWMSELEMEFLVSDYARSGFTGGLNWYRAMDIRWEQRKKFYGTPNTVPFYFIGSENDTDLEAFHGEDPLGKIRKQYSDLRGTDMVPKAGHFMHLERTAEVNALIVKFLKTLG